MPKMNDSNDRVEETGEQALETVSCDNRAECSSFKQSRTKKPSRQLNYYYRKTANKEKRKYVPYSEQESPSWHLKRYYAKKRASEKTTETAADLISTSCADADAGDGPGYDIWLDAESGCIDQTSESGEDEPLQYWSEETLNSCLTESEASISDSDDEEFWSSDEDEEMASTPQQPSQTVDDLSSK